MMTGDPQMILLGFVTVTKGMVSLGSSNGQFLQDIHVFPLFNLCCQRIRQIESTRKFLLHVVANQGAVEVLMVYQWDA